MDLKGYVAVKARLDAALQRVTPRDHAIKLSTSFYCELALHGLLDSFLVDATDDSWEITTYAGFLVARAGNQEAEFVLTRNYPCNLQLVAGAWTASRGGWAAGPEAMARPQ